MEDAGFTDYPLDNSIYVTTVIDDIQQQRVRLVHGSSPDISGDLNRISRIFNTKYISVTISQDLLQVYNSSVHIM